MSKVAVVYWSQSGNTQAMAEAVAEGAGTEAIEVSSFSAADAKNYDAFAFGCPAMGAEELESDEFEPVWDECVPELKGKTVALFGSYGWGDGEYLDTWKSQAEDAGIKVVSTVICNDAPDDDVLSQLKDLGAELADLFLRSPPGTGPLSSAVTEGNLQAAGDTYRWRLPCVPEKCLKMQYISASICMPCTSSVEEDVR